MRVIATIVIVLVFIATTAAMAAGPSDDDPGAFAVWERPALGLFFGATGNGDSNSRDSSPELGLAFDTPVVFGWRVRADAFRTSWLFGVRNPPAYELEPGDTVTLKSVSVSILRVRHANSHLAGYAGIGYGSYHYAYSSSRVRDPWRGGSHGIAGVEWTSPDQRLAFDAEVRAHGIEAPGHAPVVSDVLFKLDAGVGLKLRF